MDLIRKYEVVILQFQKKPELSLWNVHRLYISVDFFGDKLQVLLQIVGQGSHQNMFIGIFYSSGIHPFHVVVINQRTQNWLTFKTMHKRAVEHMLEAELDDHLDTEKHQKTKDGNIAMVTKPRK